MSRELIYLILIFMLLVLPRVLQRIRLPAPVTCLALGIAVMLVFPEDTDDAVVVLLSTLGISSLFLFAGLEVDVIALRTGARKLITHLLIRMVILVAVALAFTIFLQFSWRTSALLTLALLTPSTGFILDTLSRLGLDKEEQFWVTSKAIAGEILALLVLFFVMLAGDPAKLAISSGIVIAMVVALPLFFIALGRWVVPHAPGSEFSLLVMVGMLAAYITYKLGVYYLMGAFIAGLVARSLQRHMPSLASHDNLHALRLFATFFVPFYFFHAGLGISREALTWQALIVGVLLTVVILPLRVGMIWLQRRFMFGETNAASMRVALALAPTLVFTLVLADILQLAGELPPAWIGGLLFYTLINTVLPSLLLRAPFDLDPLNDIGQGGLPQEKHNEPEILR